MKFNLPFSFLKKKEKREYFLALLLRDEKATAVIFEELKGKIQIIGSHEEFFEDSIEKTSTDDFLQVLDKAISTAESTLPPNIETKKTVFGLKENWVEEARIKKEYLARLKKASEALGLSPIGFLVIQEAIAHLMQKEEGAPISAILLETGKRSLTVSLFRAGRLIETRKASVENSIAETCDKILHHFISEILPSRIIILDEKNGEKLQQQFISHSWSKSLSFLHVPQAAILPKQFDAKAILFGAAVQMGFEMLTEDDLNIEDDLNKNVKDKIKIEEIHKEQQTKDEEFEERRIEEDKPKLDYFDKSSLDFGFKIEEDIALISIEETPKEKKVVDTNFKVNSADKNLHTENNFDHAFSENSQIENTPLKDEANKKIEDMEEIDNFKLEEVISEEKEDQPIKKTKKQSINVKLFYSYISKLKTITSFFLKKLKLFRVPSLGNKKIIFVPVIIVIIIISGFIFYTYSLHAAINLNIAPKAFEETKEITFSTTKPSDYSKGIINAESVSVTEDGEVNGDVTGKKEVGTSAKGTITIYSRLSQGKTFNTGTVVKSTNGLEFTLDKSITVASSSAADSPASTIKADVTAKDIGKESNLPSGTKFTIGSYDQADVVGKNEEAFSGGTKKEITAVSKTDLDKLLTELPKNLEKKANDALLETAGNDKTVLPVFTNTSFVKKEFDKKIGDEANNIKLLATVSFESFSYKKADIEEFSKTFLGTSQNDLKFSDEGIKYEVIDLKLKNAKEAVIKLRIKTSLIPNIDQAKLINDVSGKSFDEAEKILLNIPQAQNVNISLSPNIPFLPKTLPKFPKNIKLLEEYN